MPNIPPLITAMPESQSLYAPYTPAVPVFPAGFGVFGVASNITWGVVSGTIVLGAISVPGLTETGVVQVTIQNQDATDIGAATTLIVMEAVPSSGSGGQIRVYLNRAPLVTAQLFLSWNVLKYA